MNSTAFGVVTLAVSTFAAIASAQEPPPAQSAPEATAEPAPEKHRPAPYSLPWQLRSAVAATAIRSDTAFAFYKDATGNGKHTVVSTLLASYKVIPQIAPFVRVAFVGADAFAVSNPIIGSTFAFKPTKELRLAVVFCMSLPIGMGGGDSPDKDVLASQKAALFARSAMDNALFAVNDFAMLPGLDLAYVAHNLTVQGEVTVGGLVRTRGGDAPAKGTPPPNPDNHKLILTSGLHAGYFFLHELSLGVDLRYQRWLSTPVAVTKDGNARETVTLAVGPRAHFKLGKGTWFRPGIAYARGLDQPMWGQSYNIVQLDLPISF